MKKTIIILAVVAIMMCAASAIADVVQIGDPFDTNSWAQRFEEKGVGLYDHLQFVWLSGSTFKSVGSFGNFSPAGTYAWTTYNSAHLLTADVTPSLSTSQFNVTFNDPKVTTKFYFQAFRGNTALENTQVTWNNGWSYLATSNAQASRVDVPEPMSIMLGIMGLGSIAGFRKLRRK